MPPMSTFRHNNQDIEVTIWSHFIPGCGTKQDNPQGMDSIDNPLN